MCIITSCTFIIYVLDLYNKKALSNASYVNTQFLKKKYCVKIVQYSSELQLCKMLIITWCNFVLFQLLGKIFGKKYFITKYYQSKIQTSNLQTIFDLKKTHIGLILLFYFFITRKFIGFCFKNSHSLFSYVIKDCLKIF